MKVEAIDPSHKRSMVKRNEFPEFVGGFNYVVERVVKHDGQIRYLIYVTYTIGKYQLGTLHCAELYVKFYETKSRLEAELFMDRVKSTKWADRYKNRDERIVMRAE